MKTSKWAITAVLAGVGIIGMGIVSGCANQPTTVAGTNGAVKAFNKDCPIMHKPVASAELTREFNGRQVAFCCPGCPEKWDKLSDQEKQQALAGADSQPRRVHPALKWSGARRAAID